MGWMIHRSFGCCTQVDKGRRGPGYLQYQPRVTLMKHPNRRACFGWVQLQNTGWMDFCKERLWTSIFESWIPAIFVRAKILWKHILVHLTIEVWGWSGWSAFTDLTGWMECLGRAIKIWEVFSNQTKGRLGSRYMYDVWSMKSSLTCFFPAVLA